MSDFEINAMVSKILFGSSMVDFDCNPFPENCSGFSYETERGFYSFNGCNNPSDAWPIIMEYQISIVKYEGPEKWDAHGGGVCVDYDHCIISSSDCSCSNKNPLRAAMVVFLMMQEQEK